MIDIIHIANSLFESIIKRNGYIKKPIKKNIDQNKVEMSKIRNELFEVKEAMKAMIISEIVDNFDHVSVLDAAEDPDRWREFLKKKTFQVSSKVENQFLSAMSNLEKYF